MKDYEVHVQDDGHMVLPADLLQTLGLAEGDRLVFRASGDRVELITARRSRDRAQDRMKKLFPDASGVVDEFLAERRAEASGARNVGARMSEHDNAGREQSSEHDDGIEHFEAEQREQ